MRSRILITVLALMGVLVHALAVVRHTTTMVIAVPAAAAETAGPEATGGLEAAPICHSSANEEDAADGQVPPGAKTTCPICLGLVSAVAPAPVVAALSAPTSLRCIEHFAVGDQRVQALKRIRPPSRGPPSLA